MARKIAGGRAGSPSVGAINVDPTAIMTAANNQDITIAPQGTAVLSVTNNVEIGNQSAIRFEDADSSNWVAFRAPSTVASNVTWTLPSADASGNQVLQSNGSGVLTWVNQTTAGVSASDPGASSTTNYVFFGTNAGSIYSGSQVTSMGNKSNLTFIPSTGTLSTSEVSAGNVYGSTSSSGTLTIRGTTSATKATASVLLTDNVAAGSTTTGTLVVTGGVGISGALYIGGNAVSNGSAVLTAATSPYLGTNSIIRTNSTTINEDITIPSGTNGVSAGPITIAAGRTVTVTGDWSIV